MPDYDTISHLVGDTLARANKTDDVAEVNRLCADATTTALLAVLRQLQEMHETGRPPFGGPG